MAQFIHTSDEDFSLDNETSYVNVARGHSQFISTVLPIPSFCLDVDRTNSRKKSLLIFVQSITVILPEEMRWSVVISPERILFLEVEWSALAISPG